MKERNDDYLLLAFLVRISLDRIRILLVKVTSRRWQQCNLMDVRFSKTSEKEGGGEDKEQAEKKKKSRKNRTSLK